MKADILLLIPKLAASHRSLLQHAWSASFSLEEVLTLQDQLDLAKEIASRLESLARQPRVHWR